MATINVVTMKNKKSGTLELSAEVFEAPVREHLLHAEVRRQLAKRRRGTHSTKNRASVAGGGAKPWRQKGTGRARQGTTRAPQWSGGGAVFGPVPRSYEHRLPKKARRAALRAALSQRVREGAVRVLDRLELPETKTRLVAEVVEALGLQDSKVLLVIPTKDERTERAARNLPRVRVLRVEGLNVYDVLWASRLVFTKDAVATVETRLGGSGEEAPE